MNHELVSGIVNSLPIEKMIAAPLVATVKAQSDMSRSLAHFIQDVGLNEDGSVRMVTLKYDESHEDPTDTQKSISQTRYIQAPFIAMTGLPNLAVESADISFELEVNTAEDERKKTDTGATVNASYKSWWSPVSASFTGSVTHSSEQTRHSDTRARYSFNISAKRQGPPEAFMRIIDAVTDSVARISDKKPQNTDLLPDEKKEEKQK